MTTDNKLIWQNFSNNYIVYETKFGIYRIIIGSSENQLLMPNGGVIYGTLEKLKKHVQKEYDILLKNLCPTKN